MTRSLDGQVVMVTGAARGLGAALATELAARGATVALVGLEPDGLLAVADACRAARAGRGADRDADPGSEVDAWPADVTDESRLVDVAARIRERWGRLDAVVANAGIATGGTVRRSNPAAFDRVIEVNLLGQVRTARAVLPHLIDSRGYYLQIASLAALLPSPGLAAYCAAKSGVEAFAHALAGEVRHLGVGVGIAYLSWVDTDLVRGTDEHPVYGTVRSGIPWPLNITYPVSEAATALADAVGQRRSHVMFPSWLWAAYALRALTPPLVARIGSSFARRSEEALAAHAGVPLGLVGPGGAADEQSRTAGQPAGL